jgi:pentatricopeptide repeat protein
MNRIEEAEAALGKWLARYTFKKGSSPKLLNLLEKLHSRPTPELSEREKTRAAKLNEVFDANELTTHGPDLKTWSTVINMYSSRHAWKQCIDILRYFESRLRGAPASDGDSTPQSGETVAPIAIDATTTDEILMRQLQPDDIYMIYHHTIRALCGGNQFEEAMRIVSQMQSRGLSTHPTTLVYLIKFFSESDRALAGRKWEESKGRLLELRDLVVSIAHSVLTAAQITESQKQWRTSLHSLIYVTVSALCVRGMS